MIVLLISSNGNLGDSLCALKLLPTIIEETEVQAVFYSCLSHPVFEKVHCLLECVLTCVHLCLCIHVHAAL